MHSTALRLSKCNPVILGLVKTAWPQIVKRHLAALQEPAWVRRVRPQESIETSVACVSAAERMHAAKSSIVLLAGVCISASSCMVCLCDASCRQ
jgi:hypothetical protein